MVKLSNNAFSRGCRCSSTEDWIKSLCVDVKPYGTEGYQTTEITLREVDTRHISSKTMECFDHRWLYFLRVDVDVTGHRGEYISRGMVVRICSGVCCPVDEGLKRGIWRHHRDM